MRDENEGTYWGGGGKTPVTTVCPQKVAEGKVFYDLSWRVKAMIDWKYKKDSVGTNNALQTFHASGR